MRRAARGVLAAWFVAASTLLGLPVARPDAAPPALAGGTFVDRHFRESPVFTGLNGPIAVRFAADGRAFVAEKSGRVVAFDGLGDTSPTTVLDLGPEVNDFWDRGLLGMILDPAFLAAGSAARPYLYVHYVYDAPVGGTAPTWGDACPLPPGATEDGCVVSTRLERFTVNLATNVADPGSRKELLHDGCAQFPSHSGGGMAFGPDGMLYVAGGDGAAFHIRDYGQLGGTLPDPANPVTPVNPCGDPVTVTSAPGDPPVVDPVTAEGGSLRSQDVRTTGDPTGLDGALVRIHPDTGEAAPGNPLAGSPDPNARRIVAHGFRNPLRIATRPGTDELYIGDVGNDHWEEVERFVPGSGGTTPTTLPNYGWPCYEGDQPTETWPELGNALCGGLYAQGASAVTRPLYRYPHDGVEGPCGIDGQMTASVTGLAFYDAEDAGGQPFPRPFAPRYDGALFIADYSRDCLSVLLPDASGVPDPGRMEVVATGIGNPVDLVTGPHGDLYYPDLHAGVVMRVRYAVEPSAVATATPDTGLASPDEPLVVTLDGSRSVDADPEGELVAWRWDLDHDGVFGEPGVDRSGPVVEWTITEPAVYPVTLEVESSLGLTGRAELVVDATNAVPVPVIDLPAAGTTWAVGDVIAYHGSAMDPEDGAIPADGLSWSVGLLHCSPADCHEHEFQAIDGSAGGEVIAPDHPYPSKLVFRLAATDTHGTTRETSLELEPQAATLTVRTTPASIPVTVGASAGPAPVSETVVRGGKAAVSVPATWTGGGVEYRFGQWSDGSTARVRDVSVPSSRTLTASYVADAPGTCATATPIARGRWTSQHTAMAGDEDWYAFSIPSRRRVLVSLGDLPVDARLELRGSCGAAPIAVSDHAGTRFEAISRSLPAGTYRLRVHAPSGATAETPWVLRVRALGDRVAVTSARAVRTSGVVRVVGEVVNATGGVTGRATVTVTLLDARGRSVGRLTGTTFASRLPDGGVSPFVVRGTAPAFASVRLSVREGDPVAARSLELRRFTTQRNADGTVTESGRVRNTGTTTAPSVAVARTWYDDRGEVLDLRVRATTPSRLAPGRRGTFTIVRPVLPGVQAARTSIRAR